MDRAIDIIPVPSALGAPDGGVAGGPLALRNAGLLTALHRCGVAAEWGEAIVPAADAAAGRWEALADLAERLAATVMASIAEGRQPLVVGGDHAIAVGTWRGVAASQVQPVGLLWIDAHLDAHIVADSPSGNPHGMPLALLLGIGESRLASACVSPRHVCVVGARSWEPDEAERLRRLRVRVFDDAEIARRGLAAVLKEALRIVGDGTAGFGITLDLDVFPPGEAPGVNSPAAGGRPAAGWLAALRGLAARRDCLAVEIVECDAARDADGRTARLAVAAAGTLFAASAADLMKLEAAHGAANYAPLPAVLARAEGCRAWDVDGREYLDLMSAYSAASFGHAHPRLVEALAGQARRLAVTSRAYYNDVLPAFLRRLTEITGFERALPVNTGLEAVETALKAARKWGYAVKGIPEGRAEIVACDGNFHGRSIAIVGLSSEPQYRQGFGPFPPGLKTVPYGDAAALEAAIGPDTAAFLVEPIQCEGGMRLPPAGYLAACAELCWRHDVLLLCDEVQTGLGRSGALMAYQHEGVRPDGVILGKALGGGLYPVSAFLADRAVMDVFGPGDHGSTFGGNALAAAVGLAALDLLVEENLAGRAAELGAWFLASLRELNHPLVREVRGKGLLIGMEIDDRYVAAPAVAAALLEAGLLCKDTHGTVIRLTPPLVVSRQELETALARIAATLDRLLLQLPRAA